jgi:hypothetical protein
MRSRFLLPFLLLCGLLARAAGDMSVERNAEEILRYDVLIEVNADASLVVREDITVRAEGNEIKRGIYRDFPTRYTDPNGRKVKVGFEVREVLRNGTPETWRTAGQDNGIRVYAGKKEVLLTPGEHSYRLTYRTTRQLGIFDGHDELYYNAIGHGWVFPIRAGSVRVVFPGGEGDQAFETDVWTGPEGGKEKNATIRQSGPREVTAELTRPLNPKEGLTLWISFPKGLVTPPTMGESVQQSLREELVHSPFTRVAALGLAASFAVYFLMWFLVGRDPAKGVVIPRFAPPADVSPAAVRYLMNMGYDPVCFAATLLGIASKGWIRIAQPANGDYVLHKEAGKGGDLFREEAAILQILLPASRDKLEIKQLYQAPLQRARTRLSEVLKEDYHKTHFVPNGRMMLPGILISLATLAAYGWFARATPEVGFLMVWISFWTLGVAALLTQVWNAWKAMIASPGPLKLLGALFISAFSIPFVGGELFVGGLLAACTSVTGILLLLLLLPLGLVFRKLLKAPTARGRALMDELEGLRLYLATAETDRLNGMYPPKLTPEIFDALLPYALALGVDQQWSEQFERHLQATGAGDSNAFHHSPRYYQGKSFGSSAALAAALGAGLAAGVAAASTAPGSSSGGGGRGSSGGGGGGGGGGGW